MPYHIWAVGQGLLVELCWDTSTSTDLDLYLHRPDNQDPWYSPGTDAVVPGLDGTTCNTGNCPAELRFGLSRASWGYADSPLLYCERGPEWEGFLELGRCPNPRAADDNNQVIATGTAELIQLDFPRPDQTFRVMVQNFENLPAAPQVYVYCAGLLLEQIPPPAWPPSFSLAGAGGFGVMWRVADVRPQVDGNGLTTGCEVERLHLPGTDADYVTIDDPSF